MPGEPQPPEEIRTNPQPDQKPELPRAGAAFGEHVRSPDSRPEQTQETEQQTASARHELTAIAEAQAHTASHHRSPVDPAKRLADFLAFQKLFERKREELLGPPAPESLWEHLTTKTVPGKALLNITRMVPDMIGRIRSLGKAEALREASVKASVISREEFISDTSPYRELIGIEGNKKILENFLTRELDAEVNSDKFVALEGLTPAQFHSWVRQLGYNPFAFFSDDRGENAGRVSIDNDWPANDRHPLIETPLSDDEQQQEKALWQPVFPKLASLPILGKIGPGKWRMSRTHSVVYKLKDQEGKDVLLLPVHMDPRNAVVAVGDAIHGLLGIKPEGRNALDYHKMHIGQSKYVGTGLYDLGIKNLLRLFEEHRDRVGGLEIVGRNKIQTTGTIIGDDRVTTQIEGLVKSRAQ